MIQNIEACETLIFARDKAIPSQWTIDLDAAWCNALIILRRRNIKFNRLSNHRWSIIFTVADGHQWHNVLRLFFWHTVRLELVLESHKTSRNGKTFISLILGLMPFSLVSLPFDFFGFAVFFGLFRLIDLMNVVRKFFLPWFILKELFWTIVRNLRARIWIFRRAYWIRLYWEHFFKIHVF